MSVNFRQRAREALARAKGELAHGAPERLAYAALELRMAIECVTYERAKTYESELPPSEYDVWQPTKLMKVLLEIDPLADASGALSFGLEDEPGVQAKEMKKLGAEKVFNMAAIKKSYDALGSYLHQPTLRQLSSGGGHDFARQRVKCEGIVAQLDEVLASRIFNINFGHFTSIQCMNPECGKPVRKRHPIGAQKLSAICAECDAPYEISAGSNGEWVWRSLVEEFPCPTETCSKVSRIWPNQLKPGAHWTCLECKQHFEIGLAVFAASVIEKPNGTGAA